MASMTIKITEVGDLVDVDYEIEDFDLSKPELYDCELPAALILGAEMMKLLDGLDGPRVETPGRGRTLNDVP